MRHVWLTLFALVLLTVEGALLSLFHVEFFRPDLILVFVVFISLNSDPLPGSATVFFLGLVAESFSGIHAGILVGAYLLVWILVRVARTFLLPHQNSVQLVLLFVSSMVMFAYIQVLWPSLGIRHGSFWTMGAWGALLAFENSLLAVPVWYLAGRIMGKPSNSQKEVFMKTG